MRKLSALLLTLSILATPLFAAAPFTLEQVLGSPFPENLVAAPHGDAVAWVLNRNGVRNVWVARAPGFEAAAVTRFTADDGQEIGEICWKTDASALFFTRGGDPNGRGEFPNPRSVAAGVRQEVWISPLPGDARKIADGHSPAVAPDGSMLAWIAGGQIWGQALAPDAKPAQLLHARGSAADLQWSPDSTRIAFSSDRGDHAFIGIYSVPDKTAAFVDASVDRDQSPVWSADGRLIAFIRLPASRYAFMFGPKRTAEPWSIRLADAATGKGHELWRAEPGMGSVFWPMSAAHRLIWTADRIAFPWERDGWLHLYSIPASLPAQATLLTPGNFEIEHVALAADGQSLVYSSNRDDIDRRHLWRVAVRGGTPQRLTPGSGLEWSPAPLAGNRIAFLHSDAKMPARAALMENAGPPRDLAPATMPADFPAAAMATPQPVTISAADGMQIHGQLFLPPATGAGAPHPAVIFFHGGSRRQMLLGWHNMFYYHQAYAFNQYLASKGYVVLSVNYRSGIGYGEEFREALHYGATGGSEFLDVMGAGLYLRGRPDVDGRRIGLWGGSYGGYLTALGLARASDLFAVGVDLHGVHNWNLEISNFVPAYEPEKRLDVARVAFESSPLAHVSTWRSPVLLIHGDDDRNVPFAESVQLAEALRERKVPFEQLIFPDEIHDFLVHAHWLAAYHAADEFLGRYLKP